MVEEALTESELETFVVKLRSVLNPTEAIIKINATIALNALFFINTNNG